MEKFRSLPVLLVNQKILLVGGGKVAYAKARVLKDNNIEFEIVSLSILQEIKKLDIPVRLKKFERTDLNNYNIIVDATGMDEVRNIIFEEKKTRNIFVNVVDVPQYCDFYFSALLQYKNLKIAVSSDGASPTLSQFVRNKIKKIIPAEIRDISEKKFNERKAGLINVTETKREIQKVFGKVYIIGCGTGDPELLTMKALRIIQSVDIVLFDHLISDEIFSMIPDGVIRINAGKQKGNHTLNQETINDMLLRFAADGLTVARLKSGDPFVFGRGAEEAAFLIRNDVKVEIVPGISSALAAPLSAGIPATARGIASGFSVVTGCLQGDKINFEWLDFLRIKNHTTILLMGLSYIDAITKEALASGVDEDLPCAIISNATRVNQEVVLSPLKDLSQSAKFVEGPSVIVFGNVVKFHDILPSYIHQNEQSKIPEEVI